MKKEEMKQLRANGDTISLHWTYNSLSGNREHNRVNLSAYDLQGFHRFLFLNKAYYFFNWSIVDLQCCTARWLSYTYIYTFFFLYSFPLWFISGDWIQFPVLYSRTLLFIHSECNSLHLPNVNSLSIPLPPPLGNHKSDLYVCESVSLL